MCGPGMPGLYKSLGTRGGCASMSGQFDGSIVALITPMLADGSIDWAALDSLIEWHIASGTNGIVSVGTTGESATLDVNEHLEVIRRTVEVVAGRIPVIAGTGANATSEAIHLSQAAERIGADACLLVTPYYNKPTQAGLIAHYSAIAKEVSIPQILYNVPGRTACDLLPETVAQLAESPLIVAIKEASGEASRVTDIRFRCGDECYVLSGEDGLTLEMMELGAVGVISVTANVVPRLMADFCRSHASGRREEAERLDEQLQPLHAALFLEPNPIPVKWALHLLGRVDSGIRLPLQSLSEAHRKRLMAVLEDLGSKETM